MMEKLRITRFGNGFILSFKGIKVALDKVSDRKVDYHFISHAHMDHLPRKPCGKVLASSETIKLASERGMTCNEDIKEVRGLDLVNSGHILGSRALLIEDKILYTGDLNIRDRLFIKGFKTPRVEILIMEATYGREKYVFDEFGKLVEKSLKYVLEAVSSGRNVLLIGHSLGKAQLLTKLFSWYDGLIVDENVWRYNRIYEELGVNLGSYVSFKNSLRRNLLRRNGWLMIASKNSMRMELARKYNALTVEFTGWAENPGYQYWAGVDKSFSLSDHADFKDLIKIVEEAQPSEVYIAYGFSEEFSSALRRRGFKAVPLPPNQRRIVEF